MKSRLPAEWHDMALVMLTATLVGMTMSLTVPLLSLVLEREGFGTFTIGLNTAAGSTGIFLIAPFVQPLLRRLGFKGCFQLALLVTAAVMLVFPLWIEPGFWIVLQLVFSSAAALLFVLSEAGVNALIPEALRGRIIGIYATLFCIGFAAGPLVLALAGSEGWTPFLLASALFILGLIPASRLRGIEDRLAAETAAGYRLIDTWRVAPVAMAGVFTYAVLEASHFALLPLYALGFGMGEHVAALLVALWISGNIILQYPLGWLADRWPRQHVMLLCASLAGAGLLLMPLVTGSAWLLWPLLIVLGGVMGGFYTLSLVLVGQRFQGADLTRANTAFVMTFQIGAMLGAPYTGATMQALGTGSFPLALILPLLGLGAMLAGLAQSAATSLPRR